MIDEAALQTYLTDVAAEITRTLSFEELQLIFERLEETAAVELGREVNWRVVVDPASAVGLAGLETFVPVPPFWLTRDELALIDAALIDVVGPDFRAFELRSGRRPAIWRGFVLEGARGRFRLELWLCD